MTTTKKFTILHAVTYTDRHGKAHDYGAYADTATADMVVASLRSDGYADAGHMRMKCFR